MMGASMMRLSEYRAKNDMRIVDLADLLGLSVGYVSDLCTGKRSCSLETALLIEERTGGKVKPRDLLIMPAEV